MENPPPAPSASGSNRVPAELLEKLGEANAKFTEGKEHFEAELDSFEPDREHRLDRRREEMREAEKHVEEAAEQIHQAISKPQDS